MAEAKLRPINVGCFRFRINSISPLVMHKWSEKAKRMMEEKHAGRKTRARDKRDVDKECDDAAHMTTEGEYGFPAGAFKKCLINAAHKDIGIEKTLVKKAIFIRCSDTENVVALIEYDGPYCRQDVVRVGNGGTDLRYRPEFRDWGAEIECDVDQDLLTPEDLVNLINRAGFGIGLLEMRPERAGDYGRFEFDTDFGLVQFNPKGQK